jgi:spermidine/putrescine transport system substrate-binding protein
MGDKKVMSAFSSLQLQAIQWDTLEEDISRCVDYDLVPNSVTLLRRLEKVRQDLAPR